MAFKQRPIGEQVIVITGASSGIGLATARLAAERGARVVLVARNGVALVQAAEQIRAAGGEAIHVAADVADPSDVRRAADVALQAYGRIDAWVNNAGGAIYGLAMEVEVSDMRRLFETNFWGVVHGSRVAVEHMRERGGTLVNIGSVDSDIAVPLHSAYVASKHAVKGFTDVLRMELEKEAVPVHVTLVKPAGIDTPFFAHARNYMDRHPQPPPPVYAPEVVARAILACCESPQRDVIVGGAGKFDVALYRWAPRLADKVFERTMFEAQKRKEPRAAQKDALFNPRASAGEVRGDYPGRVLKSSAYTALELHSKAALAAVAGLATFAGVFAWARSR